MRRALPLLVSALAVALVGCQSRLQTIGGTPRQKAYRSVVSLSPGTTEIIAGNLYDVQLKGRTAADDWPATVTKIPVVASVKPDYEKLATIQPDLIVYDASLYNENDLQKLKETGAELYPIDADTIEGFERELYGLSNKLGGETSMSSYVDRIEIAKNAAVNPNAPKVAVVMGGGAGEDMVAGTGSFVADAVKAAGGQPVGPSADRFVPLNAEALVALNPDVLIIPVNIKNPQASVGTILNDPRLRTLSAVKAGRVKGLDQDILLRRGGRVDKLIAGLNQAIAPK